MLLETLDVKKNDILIYSQNIFHIEKNFKIVFKDDPERIARKINYGDVCRFVNEFTPKNLIVYRLLTNIKDFQIDLSKYGFMIYINGEKELIYFDPVFAVKELEEYNKVISLYNLRFRIQQIGLTTLNRKNDMSNFAEIYHVDLEATEAKFQNDKVFADAILSFDQNVKEHHNQNREAKSQNQVSSIDRNLERPKLSPKLKENKSFAEKIKPVTATPNVEQIENIKLIKHDISEDKDFDYKQIIRMNFKGKTGEIPEFANQSENTKQKPDPSKDKLTESEFSKFLKKKLNSNDLTEKEEGTEFANIFKTPSPLKEYISNKENKKIVLQLKNK